MHAFHVPGMISSDEEGYPLRNPENDIELVGPALEKSGFTVAKIANAKAADILAAMDAFIARLATVENPVLIVYFAGHGAQIDGENYLLPVDTRLGQSTPRLRDAPQARDQSTPA